MKIQKIFNDQSKCVEVFYIKDDGQKISIDIFEKANYGATVTKAWGVNWGAYGTSLPEDAKMFALLLLEAAIQARYNNMFEKLFSKL